MPRKKLIPDEIREQVIAIVNQFNEENTLPPEANPMQQILKLFGRALPSAKGTQHPIGAYVPRFRGAYLYLDRVGYNQRPSQICRLKWKGAMDGWEFAIYKYSDNGYDPDEWMFPGSGEVDGTIPGAMRAGNKAYPL
ncbi:MAG: hypothetical protein H6658_06620 [Ardenticatenaceae bacterium]|nr:hypothetical protein [Ardenticatenaceae bacterium]